MIDDVFVRQDLYDGKYAPNMVAWAEFESLMGDSCKWKGNMMQLEDIVQHLTRDKMFRIKL